MTDQIIPIEQWNNIGQIRLAELSVYNWGSFNSIIHTASIDPMGTLITGDNGAGKSTFVDGLMALLLPAGKATFNVAAAQGARSDRTLLSYMRGSFGSAHDGTGTRTKSKRESAVVTGLRALYKADDGSHVTLAALFWTTQPTNTLADVKRIYLIARRNLTLKEMLDAFSGENPARALKQTLRDDPSIAYCAENFADYQELYRKLLHMENKNAPALLSRALGLKKIDDLTLLIRELVLEPSTVKEDAKKVVEEFSDLVAIHNKLVDARTQKEHLIRLPELRDVIDKVTDELERLSSEKSCLSIYFGEVFAQLWSEKISEIEGELQALALKIKQAEERESDATEAVERTLGEYLQLGGDKIESLKKDIEHTGNRLERLVLESSRYQNDAKTLELNTQLAEEIFLENQSLAGAKLNSLKSDTAAAQDRFGQFAGELSKLQKQNTDIDEEIKEIESRPGSNIDVRFQQLRDDLVSSLNLNEDQCVFIGELIDVKDEDRAWQGAIERALGGLRTTLAVPSDYYSMVTRWLNVRHTGLHVRVQVVNLDNTGNTKIHTPEFKPNGYLRKLIWREHPYRAWLKNHLNRYDLQCVASTEELDRTPFSMTQQGLTQMDRGRFEKKDQHRIDERKWWYLGFSNKSRLALLNNEKNELSNRLPEALQKVTDARKELNSVSNKKNLWEKIQAYRWDDINAPYWQEKLKRLKQHLEELEKSGGDLEKAKLRWESAKAEVSRIQTEKLQLVSDRGGVKNSLKTAKQEHEKAQSEAKKGLSESTRELLYTRVGSLSRDDLNQASELMTRTEKELEHLLDICRSKKGSAERSAIGIMSSFRVHEKWQVITVDWQSDISSLPDYINHLQELENEGLPYLVEQFVERLNKHATESLAHIKITLDSERENILERISVINQVLGRTEFRSGSYLKLGSKKEKFPHVQEFEQDLSKVLSQVTSDDHEGRFKQLAKVVGILEKASAPGTSDNKENLRLLDPRYQMSFYAEELDIKTDKVRDVLESSSGKSGGEKESFAGTIVAASLAYVLTPENSNRPVYCTVFLDEAFSNTSETVSRRVLRVFKELHIHINMMTPLRNIDLARESARSLLLVERNQENHDSQLCEVTWEEIDRIKQKKDKKLSGEASALDIHIVSEEPIHTT